MVVAQAPIVEMLNAVRDHVGREVEELLQFVLRHLGVSFPVRGKRQQYR